MVNSRPIGGCIRSVRKKSVETVSAVAPARETVRGSTRAELQALFAANRHLFTTYVLCEQLDRLWTYKTRPGVLDFLRGWIKALLWQRLPEMERLGDSCSSTSRTSRRTAITPCASASSSPSTRPSRPCCAARGMRDEVMLLLKLKWAMAHPIRSARDLARFLNPQIVSSNR